ncbi:Conserved_hypothetical protein [Hexamita inflata]|uniref:Uncharacterized protein n=1 Tax=Hexamita inflata TaxID=28002 RepID=A0AA86PXT5_9EUKA|nr:Conserved hypothetical protein [Hexamita inflata]
MEEYHQHGLQGIQQFQQINRMLNAMLLNPSTKVWAQNTLNVLYSQTPDIEATQQWHKKHYFDAYQKEFDELNAIASKITKNDTFQDLKDKVGNNSTYFSVNGHEHLAEGIPYKNPQIFSNFSKDVVFVFNDFSDTDILNVTVLETCSLVDRIWIYVLKQNDKYNVIDNLFGLQYISLVQFMIYQERINEFINNNMIAQTNVIAFKFIYEIQKDVSNVNINQVYRIKSYNSENISQNYLIIVLFTKYCNYQSNLIFYNQINSKLIMVTKYFNPSFIFRFDNYLDLLVQFNNTYSYKRYELNQIIQKINQLIYDDTPKFGNVNTTLVFIKPIYVDFEYLGSVYKLVDYYQYSAYNILWMDQISRSIIKQTNSQRVIVDSFAQYSSIFTIDKERYKNYYQLQPIVFNHSDSLIEYTDQNRVTTQQIYDVLDDEIFTRRDFTKYQKQYQSRQYSLIFTISSKAVGYLQRRKSVQCQQFSQDVLDQINLFRNYKSSRQMNITSLRQIASPSHVHINPDCPNKLGLVCLGTQSMYLNYKEQMQKSFDPVQLPVCTLSRQSKFTFHYDIETIFEDLNKLENVGNITNFKNAVLQCIQLLGDGRSSEAFSIPLVQFILSRMKKDSINDALVLRGIIQKIEGDKLVDVMFDEIVPEDIQIIIPLMLHDLLFRSDEISMFTALTYSLDEITDKTQVQEITLGYISNDMQEITAGNLYQTLWEQNISDNDVSQKLLEVQQMYSNRIDFYKKFIQTFQLHYFSFSTGENWIPLMREQLKSQPLGLTEKFRIGSTNGQLTVTKALTVTSKTLDNQTSINGFLSIVLKEPFALPITEEYTLFDTSMRYISGVKNPHIMKGVKQILFQNNYIKSTQVNYTLSSLNHIIELDYSFWNDALSKAETNQFTIAVSQNKITNNNYISEAQYNESQIHRRTVIFNAQCDYFISGQIIVKQFGAIDGLLVVYKDVVTSDFNEKHSNNQQFLKIENLQYYSGNLNKRDKSTTYYSNQLFPVIYNKYQLTIMNFRDNICILFICLFIIITTSIITFLRQFRKYQQISFQYYSDVELQQEKIQNTIQIQLLYHYQINYVKKFVFQQLNPQKVRIINTINKNNLQLIFGTDMNKYGYLKLIQLPQLILENLILKHNTSNYNDLSFTILASSQQYYIMKNNLLKTKSWLQNIQTSITGSMHVTYKSKVQNFKKLKVKHVDSQSVSMASSVMSSFDNSTFQFNDSQCQFAETPCADQMYEFYDRNIDSPCVVRILQFVKNEELTQFSQMLEMSVEVE